MLVWSGAVGVEAIGVGIRQRMADAVNCLRVWWCLSAIAVCVVCHYTQSIPKWRHCNCRGRVAICSCGIPQQQGCSPVEVPRHPYRLLLVAVAAGRTTSAVLGHGLKYSTLRIDCITLRYIGMLDI